jgi:hypothetical protein
VNPEQWNLFTDPVVLVGMVVLAAGYTLLLVVMRRW